MNTPSGWSKMELGETITTTQLGGNYSGLVAETGIPMMKMGNMGRGSFVVSAFERLSPDAEINPRDFLRSGDLILNTRNSLELVGKVALWRGELKTAVFNSNMMRLVPDSARVGTTAFLNYLLNSEPKLKQIRQRATGTTSVAAIYWRDLESLPLLVPSLPEQQKIADILGTWDEALEKLDALIAAKERRKQALMQQLLTGRRRLPGFSGPWTQTTFGQFLTESRTEGSDGLTAQKITVKLYGRGVLAKQERMVGSSNTKYFVRRAGQFIYSKLDFLNGAFGVIPLSLDGYESTLDLPAFEVSPSADARWLLAYVVRPEFYEKQIGAAAGGRIARRVNPDEFLKLRLRAPDICEQRAIAAVLDAADSELRLLREQRSALDQQKRGLMQQLLTGKVRVFVQS